MRRRIGSLLVPYLAWQVLTVAWRTSRGARYDFGWLVKSVFLLQGYPPDGPLWYVYVVFLLSLCAPLFLLLLRSRRLASAVVFVLPVATFHILTAQPSFMAPLLSITLLKNIMNYFPSYLLGAYIGHFATDDRSRLDVCLAMLLASLAIEGFMGRYAHFAMLRVLPIVALFYLRLPDRLAGRDVYKLSFLVYALHEPFIAAFVKRANALTANVPYMLVSDMLVRLVYLALVIAAAWALHAA